MADLEPTRSFRSTTSSSKWSHFIKDKKVGEGTYATVYLGWAVPIRKEKVAERLAHDHTGERERLAKDKKLIDVFSHKTNLNLVLEYLDADLEMVIKNKTVVFSAADVKSWMLMTLRGLYHCHRNFILHRDLKPNNLLLASDGQLKLADFGMARDYGDPHKKMTSVVVTRWYRAPELLLGATRYGYAIDMWAVGCIFAELMLRTPFMAGDSDIGQLQIIFKALGTPTEQDWPGMKELDGYFEFQQYPKPPLRSILTAASPDALNLLEQFLLFDPLKRITAEDALKHFYFRNLPRPTPPHKLPRDVGGVGAKRKEGKGEQQPQENGAQQRGVKRKGEFEGDEDERGAKIARRLFD
ncbi:CMGC/CDK/CDK7 protein kinase [Spizellomyces punctatus DAOM BR117]|uniref:[RNA-polymerase]-subunit kinase n=1 Tax=Spizellomyces punctatus (strain DAOM BR117) TaxID=645134 RepID=A0A0L0HHD1_SPIPD|nr:CMGC/CDK/CDK7 protein kinase [Spizellomyces punctatus DAOM BR117]KND00881.1 CMGC/CDK/CDK7 protein kinase [Spizellomyces punctatus DAOM BR117]|eukprot:XP_016608920.1 CMGC/CDK/CDK7 protein kinase [Spizellomyces punctatus DAOM BR117]